MIKISLLLISIFSLLYGLVFSFAPFFFAELTQAEPTNIAWLRNIGASICGVLFLGLLFVYRSPSKNYDLFMIITVTSILQTLGLIFSRFFNEIDASGGLRGGARDARALALFYAVFFVVSKAARARARARAQRFSFLK